MIISPARIVYFFLLCTLAGVALRSWVTGSYQEALIIGGVSILVTLLRCRFKIQLIVILGGAFLGLGIIRYDASLLIIGQDHIGYYNGTTQIFTGLITKDPDRRVTSQRLTVSGRTINDQAVTGKVLVIANLHPAYDFGDELQITCKLEAPQPFNDFAYDRYLAMQGIFSTCRHPIITVLANKQAHPARQFLSGLRKSIRQTIENNLSETHASLLSAMLVGGGGLPAHVQEDFSTTGTSHIIAISGMNITIIVAVAMPILLTFGLWRQHAFWVITLALAGYITLLEFPASATRAAFMGWFMLLAQYLGRVGQVGYILILTGFVMVMTNPLILRDDVGFQLSFAAMLGIAYIYPRLKDRVWFLPNFWAIRESVELTLAAQFATLPLLIWHFGRISVVAPLVNVLVVPTLSWIMAVGVGGVGVSVFFPELGRLAFLPTYLLLTYVLAVVQFFGSLWFAAISL